MQYVLRLTEDERDASLDALEEAIHFVREGKGDVSDLENLFDLLDEIEVTYA